MPKETTTPTLGSAPKNLLEFGQKLGNDVYLSSLWRAQIKMEFKLFIVHLSNSGTLPSRTGSTPDNGQGAQYLVWSHAGRHFLRYLVEVCQSFTEGHLKGLQVELRSIKEVCVPAGLEPALLGRANLEKLFHQAQEIRH